MSSGDTKGGFDPLGINFPTDRISFQQIRRQDPFLSEPRRLDCLATDVEVVATHAAEVDLAERAYSRALGKSPPRNQPGFFPREMTIIDVLDPSYKRLGLSQSVRETKRMVDDFERQAAAQASAQKTR